MGSTLLGNGRAIGNLYSLKAPNIDGPGDTRTGAGGGFGAVAARGPDFGDIDSDDQIRTLPFRPRNLPASELPNPMQTLPYREKNNSAAGADSLLNDLIDPRAEQASAINLFNDRVMTGIGAVMEQAHTGESSNVIELDRSLRGALDGHLETALGAVRDTYVVPASFIEGLKRQGAAAAQNVAGSVGRILAVRRREQHVAGFNALSDGLIRTVRQNPAKLPVALARLAAGVEVAKGTVLSAEEAERKLEDGKRALSIAAFTRLAETRPDTVIEAAPRGAFSALAREDADAILRTAKQANVREAARVKAQREVEAATRRVTSLVVGKPVKAFDPNSPGDVKLVASIYDSLEGALAAKHAAPETRREAARMEARFVARTKIMPPKVAARIEAGLAGEDTAKLITAALVFSEIAGREPKLLPCVVGDNNCLRAALVTTAVKAGLSDEEAQAGADAAIAKPGSETAKARIATYRQDRIITEAGNAAFLAERLTKTRKEDNGQALPSADRTALYNAQVEHFYSLTGNLEAARATAHAAIQRGVPLEGGAEGRGDAKFQAIAAGGGDGKTFAPNAMLGGSGSEAAVRGVVEEKAGGEETQTRQERFDKKAHGIVEGKASRRA